MLNSREYVDMIALEIRRYFDLRISEIEKRMMGERAILVSANADRQAELERRLTALNELRTEVLQDRSLFVTKDAFDIVFTKVNAAIPREYYESQHDTLQKVVNTNTTAIANMRSRSAAYTAAIGIAVIVLTAIILIVQFASIH